MLKYDILIVYQYYWINWLLLTLEYEAKSDDKRQKRGSDDSDSNPTECSFDILSKDNKFKPGAGQYCKVDPKEFLQEACTKDNKYGYPQGTPCILLKLNKVVIIRYIFLSIPFIFYIKSN